MHTNNDLVFDIINNIKKFSEEPIIVFHVNKLFSDFDYENFKNIKDVYINPVRFTMGHSDNKVKPLISNYEFLIKNEIKFDYQTYFYSKMLLVKRGLETYLSNCDSCMHLKPYFSYDPPYLKVDCNVFPKGLHYSLIEGLTLNYKISEKIYSLIKKYKLEEVQGWAPEEQIIPSSIYQYSNNIKKVPISAKSAENIICNVDDIKNYIKHDTLIQDSYHGERSSNEIFFAHRVEYNYFDPVREFVRNI